MRPRGSRAGAETDRGGAAETSGGGDETARGRTHFCQPASSGTVAAAASGKLSH